MADAIVQVAPDGTGKMIDNESLIVGANTVHRQRTEIAGAAATEVARVRATDPAGTDMALVVRNLPSGTQPVSAASLPLPAGAATEASLGTDGTAPPAVLGGGTGIRGWMRSIYEKLTGTIAVTGTFWQATQPISGSVTANVGTTGGLALDATLTGGTAKAVTRGGAKGTTAAGDITSTPVDANTQALHVDGSKVTQPVSAASLPLPAGAATEATLGARLAEATFTTRVPVQGQGAMAASVPVVIASNQSAVPISAASLPLPAGAATEATLDARTGILTEAAPASDTASSGLNGRLQRIAQRITSLIALLPAALAGSGALKVSVFSDVAGGYTPGKLISAATTNATVLKGSAGKLGFLAASNVNAAVRYLKVYDKATAPIVGTDVPKFTFAIPGNTAGAGTNLPIPDAGIDFALGIGIALTTGVTDADATAVAVNEIVVNYGTK